MFKSLSDRHWAIVCTGRMYIQMVRNVIETNQYKNTYIAKRFAIIFFSYEIQKVEPFNEDDVIATGVLHWRRFHYTHACIPHEYMFCSFHYSAISVVSSLEWVGGLIFANNYSNFVVFLFFVSLVTFYCITYINSLFAVVFYYCHLILVSNTVYFGVSCVYPLLEQAYSQFFNNIQAKWNEITLNSNMFKHIIRWLYTSIFILMTRPYFQEFVHIFVRTKQCQKRERTHNISMTQRL